MIPMTRPIFGRQVEIVFPTPTTRNIDGLSRPGHATTLLYVRFCTRRCPWTRVTAHKGGVSCITPADENINIRNLQEFFGAKNGPQVENCFNACGGTIYRERTLFLEGGGLLFCNMQFG